jgi:hypothetical protein
MNLIQIFIPQAKDQAQHGLKKYSDIRNRLIEKFGGLTEYDKAPASGFWEKNATEPIVCDQMIIYEVQCEEVDIAWWTELRLYLEKIFNQDQILIRAQTIQIL